jgi:proton-dependent oligopeptide transporter, POT family
MSSGVTETGNRHGTFLGHPNGLYVLFFAEMWERFSYYGMRALLILYLTKHFLFSEMESGLIYGAYTSLVYITPVIGGYLADKYLGQRKAVLFGGILIAIGHLLLGFEGEGGGAQDSLVMSVFWAGLAFIIVGTGFLKANISVIVGQLYPRDDARRDPAYTIFYMGINLGSFLGAIICGYLGEIWGWSYGFGAAAIGMVAGIVVFVMGKPKLMGAGEPPDPAYLSQTVGGIINREWLIYLVSILSIPLFWLLVQWQLIVGWMLLVTAIIVVGYLVFDALYKMQPVDRDRMFAVLFLIALQPLFWGLFEQAGSSLNLFTDRSVDRTLLGFTVPASVFQSINAFYIFMLAPVFAWLWQWLNKRGLEPSMPAKFALALVQVGAGFLVLVAGAAAAGPGELTPVIYIFLIYLLHTTGELCLSPVGLSAMAKLSLPRMLSLVMGTWFLSTAGGNFLAGQIAAAVGSASEESGGQAAVEAAGGIMTVYTKIGWFSIAVGVVVLLVSPFIVRLMHLEKFRENVPKPRATPEGISKAP